MSDSEGKKELVGIARAVDALFGPTEPPGAPETPDDDESGIETPPEPPNVSGDSLTGAPVLPHMPGGGAGAGDEPEVVDDAAVEGPPPLPEDAESGDVSADEPPPSSGGAPSDDPSAHRASPPRDDVPVDAQGEAADAATPPPIPDAVASAAIGDPTTPPPLPHEVAADEDDAGEHDTGPPPLPDEAVADEYDAHQHEADEPTTPLDEAVDAYLDGDRGRSEYIRRLAEEMLEEPAVDPVARAVGRLAGAAGEPPDDETLELARAIASPVVLGRLAVHIGGERDEERRAEYFVACRNLGEPMGRAIRDHLAESTDRLSRRVHCEALVEMGAVGRTVIEDMVADENRFLVRNAVAILGDTGGDGAVEMVTMALANPDARVRREALRSLAKLGDEDAGDFVLGLLDDSDRDVRIQAAVTAGELNVERALRHVIRMLDETKDPDEAIPLIRALGHLGDPGAVPSIEKHAVRTLFSRPRTDVRIAAYRALSQIGTPHARRLLNQAVDDKEPEVKAAVKEMLGMG